MTKNQQREILKSRINELNVVDHPYESRTICNRLANLQEVQNAHVILSYYPMANEADVRPLNNWLVQQGKLVAYPVMHNHEILAYISKDDQFVKGPYGIIEPDRRSAMMIEKDALDLVIVPCLGFDSQGHRLGHGGGCYDRYLADCPAYKIAVGFAKQQLDSIVVETHDILMDCVVSTDTVFRIKEK